MATKKKSKGLKTQDLGGQLLGIFGQISLLV
jgi:hypothetical protein